MFQDNLAITQRCLGGFLQTFFQTALRCMGFRLREFLKNCTEYMQSYCGKHELVTLGNSEGAGFRVLAITQRWPGGFLQTFFQTALRCTGFRLREF